MSNDILVCKNGAILMPDSVRHEQKTEGKVQYRGREYQVYSDTIIIKSKDDALSVAAWLFGQESNIENRDTAIDIGRQVRLLDKGEISYKFIDLARPLEHNDPIFTLHFEEEDNDSFADRYASKSNPFGQRSVEVEEESFENFLPKNGADAEKVINISVAQEEDTVPFAEEWAKRKEGVIVASAVKKDNLVISTVVLNAANAAKGIAVDVAKEAGGQIWKRIFAYGTGTIAGAAATVGIGAFIGFAHALFPGLIVLTAIIGGIYLVRSKMSQSV